MNELCLAETHSFLVHIYLFVIVLDLLLLNCFLVLESLDDRHTEGHLSLDDQIDLRRGITFCIDDPFLVVKFEFDVFDDVSH